MISSTSNSRVVHFVYGDEECDITICDGGVIDLSVSTNAPLRVLVAKYGLSGDAFSLRRLMRAIDEEHASAGL